MSTDSRTIPRILAECECGWRCTSSNGHPVAKRHAQKCGKRTRVEVSVVYIYNDSTTPRKP